MPWVAIAAASAAVLALSNVLDKTTQHKYTRSPLTLPFMIGIAHTTIGIIVVGAVGIPDGATLDATGSALLSGVLFGIAGNLMIRVLYSQEVSRTIPVMQMAPIFAALIGVTLLGESVSALQWVAIVATVAGAVAISLRIDDGYRSFLLNRPFFLLILASLIWASANVVGKVALNDLPLMYTHGLRSFALGIVFLVVAVRPGPIGDFANFIRQRSPALGLVVLNEFVIANGGLLLLLWALSLGPVSLVTALVSIRAMFVVLYSTTLALIWKGALGEQTSRQAIAVKVASTALIVGGVAGIAF
ncbi:MAG: EamA family transporter [Chloroflexi bacterium]|nr:EamA family transporter [Chloroflexota bacterium]